MGFQIFDGTGTSQKAKVTAENRLATDSVNRSERESQALQGDSYLVGTGLVTLTNAATSAVLYFQNDNDFDLIVTRYLISTGATTSGTTSTVLGVIVKNPTTMAAGSGNPVLAPNANFGSSNELTLTSEIGAQGASLTGGSNLAAIYAPVEQLTTAEASTILPKGASLGVTITPPASNTSITVSVGLNVHRVPVK